MWWWWLSKMLCLSSDHRLGPITFCQRSKLCVDKWPQMYRTLSMRVVVQVRQSLIHYLQLAATDIHLFTCCSHVTILWPHVPQHKSSRDISELIYFPPMVAAFTHSTFLHSCLSPWCVHSIINSLPEALWHCHYWNFQWEFHWVLSSYFDEISVFRT